METVYMVFWNDDQGLCLPCGWDADCPGALQVDEGGPISFSAKIDAQRAIRVSKVWFKLQADRGDKCIYEDFGPECAKNIKIVPVKIVPKSEVK